MAKKRTSDRSHVSISFMDVSITCDGKTIGGSVKYERTEHADGTVTEKRSSEAIPENATLEEVFAAALQPVKQKRIRRSTAKETKQ